MFGKKIVRKALRSSILVFMVLAVTQCATKTVSVSDVSDNIFGVKPGMNREKAQNRLREIGEFKEAAEKRQEVWLPKNDPRFDSIAIGYGKDGRVSYITAFSEEGKVKERVRFTDIGDITKAKREVTEPHHRYTWEVPPTAENSAYIVTVYGTDKEYLKMYSLAAKPHPAEKDEDEK